MTHLYILTGASRGMGLAIAEQLISPHHLLLCISRQINAPLATPLVPLRAAASLDTAQALRVGLEAPMLLTAAFLQATQAFGVPRKVLNISSGLGRRPMASQAAYCAAKAGMDHFTRCVALDEALQTNGAKVSSLAPGVIDTDMQTQLMSAQEAAKRVLAWLERPDFGQNPVADVRDA